jgi:MoxR-like ATPase
VTVTPTKGEPFTVNINHVLTIVKSRAGSKPIDVTVKEFMSWPKSKRDRHKLIREGVEFNNSYTLPVDPYFVGVLIGDGCMANTTVGVSTIDDEIKLEIERQAHIYGLSVKATGTSSAKTYNIVGTKGKLNPLTAELRKLGVMVECGAKNIPFIYKTASRADRLSLLAGLIDTDGTLDGAGYSYTTKSSNLAEDVKYLARSLGMAAYSRLEKYSCQNGFSGMYHRVRISGDCSIVPVRIGRKRATRRKQIKNVLRTGFTITSAGKGTYYGFSIDADHRYMMGDFTVTHNTAKSMLLRYFNQITPRGVLATGKGASAVGLSAAVVKDDISDSGGFMVEAGAMVLANNGVMFLDELDKMDSKDSSAMHEALEQGTVTINKAGLNLTLNASCTVIAAANPKEGRFDPLQALHTQLNLTPALVSRFDLIFILKDTPEEVKDTALVDHIFRTELGGSGTERLTSDFIRTYVAYARQFNPKHTEASLEPFKPYFLAMRGSVDNTTARQLEALMRLSEAHAKANLRDTVSREDSEAALLIHRAYLESQALDPRTNKLNLGQFDGVGDTMSQSDRMQIAIESIRTAEKRDIRGYCDEMAVIKEFEKRGVGFTDASKCIDELMRSSRAYRPGGPGTIGLLS